MEEQSHSTVKEIQEGRQLRRRYHSDRYPVGKKPCRRQDFQLKVRVLEDWFAAHRKFPYPSYEEKIWLANQGCISVEQVSNWFANARRRIRMAGTKSQDERQNLNFIDSTLRRTSSSEEDVLVSEPGLEVNKPREVSPQHSSSSAPHVQNINIVNNNNGSPRKYKSAMLLRYLTENTEGV